MKSNMLFHGDETLVTLEHVKVTSLKALAVKPKLKWFMARQFCPVEELWKGKRLTFLRS